MDIRSSGVRGSRDHSLKEVIILTDLFWHLMMMTIQFYMEFKLKLIYGYDRRQFDVGAIILYTV